MNTTLPKLAEPVRDYIKKHVKRPTKLPIMWKCIEANKWGDQLEDPEGLSLRWETTRYNTLDRIVGQCPLGFLPESKFASPSSRHDSFNVPLSQIGLNLEQVSAFTNWWDRQRNAKKAVDAICGEGN